MIRFPNCKINIGLYVVEKREDGYHNLETVFYPVELHDALELIGAPSLQTAALHLTGLPVEGPVGNNLCIKAWELLQQDFPGLPGVDMHLHKVIPMGAGLGGGSSDGAFSLILLNDKFQLGLSLEQLADYALRLGSDCPFFIYNQPCFATGRGEKFQPVSLDLSRYTVVIIHPGIHISTAVAFSGIRPAQPAVDLRSAVLESPATWKETIFNDFEAVAIKTHPALQDIKTWFYDTGALYASMTGTGSAFYGIYKPDIVVPEAPRSNWKLYKTARL